MGGANFGPEHADQIADLIWRYQKLNGRIKPELLSPDTFSIVNYDEAEQVLADYQAIVTESKKLQSELPDDERDAFFEFVIDPAEAYWNVANLYVTVAKNHLFAAQGRASANHFADDAEAPFQKDQALSNYFNQTLGNGRWDHMMDQTHIGYTRWQQPPENRMPEVTRIDVPRAASLGVAVEGSPSAWPGDAAPAILPDIDSFNRQSRYIDVFNRGSKPFRFKAEASKSWVLLSHGSGTIDADLRLWAWVDWNKAPRGISTATITISGAGKSVPVIFSAVYPGEITPQNLDGFLESDGCVSMEAEHFTKKIDSKSSQWYRIAGYGRTLSAMTIASSTDPPTGNPCLEYKMYLFHPGNAEVSVMIAPTQAFVPGRGLRFAISIDDQTPQVVDSLADHTQRDWQISVINSIREVKIPLTIDSPGYHTLKFWMVDPAIVLEKIVVDLGGVRPSFLGPPESYHRLGN